MKRFLKNIVIFGLLFFVFDKIFLFFIFASPQKEVDERLELMVNGKVNKEIIILGSSLGARNIIASEIEKKTAHSAYNLAYPGSNIEFHEFALRTLLKFNKAPKVVLLPVDYPMAFLPDTILNFRLERLYPLVRYNHINDELVARGERNFIASHLFVLGRINKSNLKLRQKRFNASDTLFADGSMPIRFQRKNADWTIKKFVKYDATKELAVKLECFKKIIEMCKAKNIQLMLVRTPSLNEADPTFNKRIIELAGSEIPFLDYNHQNPVYRNTDYYYDKNHLNRKGAMVFSDEIAQYLIMNKTLN